MMQTAGGMVTLRNRLRSAGARSFLGWESVVMECRGPKTHMRDLVLDLGNKPVASTVVNHALMLRLPVASSFDIGGVMA